MVNQLDNFIRLTPQEKADLKVVAISANPYGRGLDTWLKDKNYEEISKINTLKEATNKIISGNRTALITGQQQSIITDILTNKVKNIRSIFEQLDKEIRANRDSLTSLEYDLTDTEQEINSNLKRLKTELLNYIKNVKKHISGSDVETFGSIFSEEIGKDGIYLNDSLENIYKKYTNLNNTKIKMLESNLLNELDFREKVSNNVTTTVVKKGLDGIRMIPLGEMRNFVLTSRNTISSFTGITMKFKPWGAIKFAKGIGTAAGIGVAMELWDVVQKIKNTNKVKKAKEELNNALEDFEKEIDRKFGTENNIAEFSPVFQDLKKMYKGIEIQDKNISNMKVQIEEWYKSSKSIQDINFEEIN